MFKHLSEMPEFVKDFTSSHKDLCLLAMQMKTLGFRCEPDEIECVQYDIPTLKLRMRDLCAVHRYVKKYGHCTGRMPVIFEGMAYDGKHRIAYALAMGHDLKCVVISSSTKLAMVDSVIAALHANGHSDQPQSNTIPAAHAATEDLGTLSTTYSNE